MELPDLGENCSITTCKQLDFLPVRCDACKKIFCKDHFSYMQHDCPEAYRKNNQVPVCPLCDSPISVMKGELADVIVGRHIDSDCQSDTAKQKRAVYANRCSMKGCKQKELIPFKCDSCHKNYCIRHRLFTDHSCKGFEGSGRSVSNAGAAALARNSTPSSGAVKMKPQQSALTSQGKELDRLRQQRQIQNAEAPQPRNIRSMQSGMSEDEAMARAIAASFSSDAAQPQSKDENPEKKSQEEADAALARALYESEQEARRGRQPNRATAQRVF
ncbi:hypothetical protein CAPTEDRAFT_151928 [Capitella teleta]|uniref:AN1-type domain-containing protein n=1 Tax=Capitella teleta TaxID=283909 RepID=R7V8U0_CAPTE|nr:hypothetical protein CAPTEDRAFT_151928 [Capitella teleta]|eukprot:ELU12766.1 hypothetical protein CAPTEDRAFT_151928 [Capitella teleta]